MTREVMRYKLNELRMMLNDGEHTEEQGILVEIIKELDKVENKDSAFKGMTNGEVIKALFPNVIIVHNLKYLLREMQFTDDWWNSPYKGDSE